MTKDEPSKESMSSPVSETDKIMEILQSHPGKEISVEYIKERTGINVNTVYGTLSKLHRKKEIQRVRRGTYRYGEAKSEKAEPEEPIQEPFKIETDVAGILKDIDDYLFHQTFDIIGSLPIDGRNVDRSFRETVRNSVVKTLLFALSFELNRVDKEKIMMYLKRFTI